MIFALAARGGLWAVSFGIAAKNSQIFETIGGLLDREIVRLYKPGLNFGEVSDPHSAALGRRVSLGGYGFAGEFARGQGWKPSACLSPRWYAGIARAEYADGKETDCEVASYEIGEEGSVKTCSQGTSRATSSSFSNQGGSENGSYQESRQAGCHRD